MPTPYFRPLSSLYDSEDVQAVLREPENFTQLSDVDILEISREQCSLYFHAGNEDLERHIDHFERHTSADGGKLLAIFVSLEVKRHLTFSHQASIAFHCIGRLMEKSHLHPAFLPNLVGRPDYWSPGIFHDHDTDEHPRSLTFYCQHPRWNVNAVMAACSIYMKTDRVDNKTLYLIVTGKSDSIASSLTADLSHFLEASRGTPDLIRSCVADPFFLHVKAAVLIFEQSKVPVKEVRNKLYKLLDLLDEIPQTLAVQRQREAATRNTLASTTRDLNIISRNADSLISSADRGLQVVRAMLVVHDKERAQACDDGRAHHAHFSASEDHLRYVIYSLELQHSWLSSYKARKETAMNLVFNLAVQLDSLTNMEMGRSMKKDSESMNTIATLTMLFLPATAVATIFGSNIFLNELNVKALIAYIVITIVLTAFSMYIWTMQPHIRAMSHQFRRRLDRRNGANAAGSVGLNDVESAPAYVPLREDNSVPA
ncbi:hypothetical protein QBC46DRAFT_371400 [Diplogelasinospora grovesii]|uniref:Uncharacterized protein n=1 Tax=Diplogelasinospora grovesii TaxID=303347 RepID=A0AAN6SAD1_9PEZI|nr:hypothetical protein QBC46DRAFT_371400 [Diplogelasinospora grovesii]